MKPNSLCGVHVLIVEDTEDSRELFRQALQYCGALVTTAESCEQAKQILGSIRPHVIVTDIAMPDDGVELLQRTRQAAKAIGVDIPVIAVTAYSGEYMDQRGATGFVRQLFKPVDPNDLCAAVAAASGRDAKSA